MAKIGDPEGYDYRYNVTIITIVEALWPRVAIGTISSAEAVGSNLVSIAPFLRLADVGSICSAP